MSGWDIIKPATGAWHPVRSAGEGAFVSFGAAELAASTLNDAPQGVSGWNVEYDDLEGSFSAQPAAVGPGAYATSEEAQRFAEALNKQPKGMTPRLIILRGRVYLSAPLVLRILEEIVERGGDVLTEKLVSEITFGGRGYRARVRIPAGETDAGRSLVFNGFSFFVEDGKPHQPSVRESLERALMAYEVGKP